MMKIVPIKFRRHNDKAYAEGMAAQLSELKVEKRPVSVVQAASTQRVLDMTPDQLADYHNRPMPENWKANPNAKTLDEAVGKRDISFSEYAQHTATRHNRNTIGDSVSQGAKSTTQESRDRASSAFTCSPPAEINPREKFVIETLAPYTPLPPLVYEEPKKEHWIKRFLNKLVRKNIYKGTSYIEDNPESPWAKIAGKKND